MNRFLCVLVFLAVLFIYFSFGQISATEVYVSNKSIGNATYINGGFYVLLDGLKRIAEGEIKIEESNGKVLVNGKPLNKAAVRHKKNWVLPIKEVSHALGYEYKYNKDTDIIDLYKKRVQVVMEKASPQANEEERNRYINKGFEGGTFDIQQYVVSGKINIFNFYSDY